MSTYPLPELLHRWSLGQISAEQAIGHLVQNLLAITQRQTELEKRVRHREQLLNVKLTG